LEVISMGSKEENQEQETQEQPVEAFGFTLDLGRSRSSKIDAGKLEEVLKEARQALSKLSEQTGNKINSVAMPLATFNKKMGLDSHNAHSLVYNISSGVATGPVLRKYSLKLGRRGRYNAPVGDQKIAFIQTG
jgi:hypothetical protein